MNVTLARKILRLGTHTNPANWGDEECDLAIIGALQYANEETGGLKRRTSTQVTVASTVTIDLSAATDAADFDPTLLKAMRISTGGTTAYEPITHKSLEYVHERLHDDTSERMPEIIGFETPSSALLYPIPDAVYTIRFTWASNILEDLSDWVPGVGDGDSITINLPERVLYPVIQFGATAILTRAWPRNKSQMDLWRKFEEWVARQDGRYGVDGGADLIEPIDI